MLDTLFLLLFALLVTTEPLREDSLQSVRIRLPSVEGSAALESPQAPRWVIVIDADSRVRLDGDDAILASPADLDRALDARLAGELPEAYAVEIRGDCDARNGVAVQLLQHLRLRGFRAIDLIAVGAMDLESFGAGADPGRR